MPTPSTPSPSAVIAKDSTVQPVNVRPFSSNVMETSTGRGVFSFAAKTAAFISYKSVIVANFTRSAPARQPARTTSL